jgi:hypothetical protein
MKEVYGVVLLGASAAACYTSTSDNVDQGRPLASPAAAVTIDETALVLKALKYKSQDFIRASSVYPSSATKSAQIQVFVSKEAHEAYQRIEPSATGSDQRIAEGSIVVREILDKAGIVQKLTMVAQGPKGYNPISGDLWFASTDINGNFLKDGTTSLHGPLPTCSGCHAARAMDGYLFGVESSAKFKTPIDAGTPDNVRDAGAADATAIDSGAGEPADPNPPTPGSPDSGVQFDLSGLSLVRDDMPASRKVTFLGPTLNSGDIVVVSRNADKPAFEVHWRTSLASQVKFINARGAWPSRAAVANRTGRWNLLARDGAIIDGPTPLASSLRAHERRTAALRWFEVPQAVATPGISLLPANKSGLWISEWSDGDTNFDMEFIELIWNQ